LIQGDGSIDKSVLRSLLSSLDPSEGQLAEELKTVATELLEKGKEKETDAARKDLRENFNGSMQKYRDYERQKDQGTKDTRERTADGEKQRLTRQDKGKEKEDDRPRDDPSLSHRGDDGR